MIDWPCPSWSARLGASGRQVAVFAAERWGRGRQIYTMNRPTGSRIVGGHPASEPGRSLIKECSLTKRAGQPGRGSASGGRQAGWANSGRGGSGVCARSAPVALGRLIVGAEWPLSAAGAAALITSWNNESERKGELRREQVDWIFEFQFGSEFDSEFDFEFKLELEFGPQKLRGFLQNWLSRQLLEEECGWQLRIARTGRVSLRKGLQLARWRLAIRASLLAQTAGGRCTSRVATASFALGGRPTRTLGGQRASSGSERRTMSGRASRTS